jgi:type IV secretory pathway VirD2 relaxase
VIEARVVRHRGTPFCSASPAKHVNHLKRDGVTRDHADATMFDAAADRADERAFASRIEGDWRHLRFIVWPDEAATCGTCVPSPAN